jgi:hypothetical protein
MHGVDEFCAPREWNEEIQAINTLPDATLEQKTLKAQITHKIITEFTEACKTIAVAISEGEISHITTGIRRYLF